MFRGQTANETRCLWTTREPGIRRGCSTVPGVEPVWLTDAEQVAWRRLIAVVMLLPHDLDVHMREDHDVNMHEYWVLAMLSETPSRSLRMHELARRSQVSASRLSHTVSRLEQRGWVIRERSTTDKRGLTAHLTDEGWKVVRAAAPDHVAKVRDLVFAGLSAEDVAELSRILDAILTRLDPGGDRSPGGRF